MLALIAAILLTTAVDLPARAVRVELQPVVSGTPAGMLALTSATDPEQVVEVDAGKEAQLPVGSRWIVSGTLDGWWVHRELFLVEAGEGSLVIPLRTWPTGRLEGTLKLAGEQQKLPEKLTVTLEQLPRSTPSDLPRGATIDCAVDRERRWHCDVPATGPLDLAIRASGFVPHYRWDVEVARGGVRKLGVLTLHRGSSVAGWVRTADKSKPANARVKLTRLVSRSADPLLRERLQRPVATAAVSANGFFQLSGIEAGSYAVLAEMHGFAPAVLQPVEVFRDAEVAIQPLLVLQRPIPLRIEIDPPADWLDRPWHVAVTREDDTLLNATADERGAVRFDDQTPGVFDITVSDALDNPLKTERLTFASADAPPARIRLDLIRVTGEVRRADRPVAAKLWFGGRFGLDHMETRSDADGQFAAVLPRAGEWNVEAEVEPGLVTRLQVLVEPKEGVAKVVLELPSGRLEGVVVDERGTPVAKARVMLDTPAGIFAHTGPDGRFALLGVPPGTFRLLGQLRTEGKLRMTKEVVVTIADDAQPPDVELRLQPLTALTGRVVSLRGAVAGALVSIQSVAPVYYSRVTTDLEGNFAADVPEGTRTATVTVMPPGHALRAFDVPVDGREVVLHVPTEGGTLRLLGIGRVHATLAQNGQRLFDSDLLEWARSQGTGALPGATSLDLPRVSAGVYRACVETRCREVTVAPGSVAELDLRQ